MMGRLTSLVLKSKRNTHTPFLDLPGELRDLIYSFVFAFIENQVVLPITRPTFICNKLRQKVIRRVLTPRGRRVPHLALLMTCRQIRAEAFHYVHGTVHAMLVIPNSAVWALKRVRSDDLRQEIKKALRYIGGALAFVTHLNLLGAPALALLTRAQNADIDVIRHSRDSFRRRGAQISDTFVEVCRSLPNVRCVTSFEKGLARLQVVEDLEFVLVLGFMCKTGPEGIATAFPLLTEIRLQNETTGWRIRKEANGQWHERFGHARTEARVVSA